MDTLSQQVKSPSSGLNSASLATGLPARYTYVRIGRLYFCLQQNPVRLTWLLTGKARRLRLGSLRLGGRTALSIVKKLIRCQLRLRHGDPVLKLPFYGQLCLPVHRGYKVINLSSQTVVKMFVPTVSTTVVVNEIAAVRSASQLECAPAIRNWSVEERWYEEGLMIGCRADLIANPESALETFQRGVAPCLAHMILLHAPRRVKLGDYLHQAAGVAAEDEVSRKAPPAKGAGAISSFIEFTTEQLRRHYDQEIDLVFSHGDFSLCNMLKTSRGIVVIDWENAGPRNPLYDLYNFFFTEMYYGRLVIEAASIVLEEAVASLKSCLPSRSSHVAQSLTALGPLYRKLYYFERILVLLSRELTNERLRTVLRSIELFNHYEEVVTGGVCT